MWVLFICNKNNLKRCINIKISDKVITFIHNASFAQRLNSLKKTTPVLKSNDGHLTVFVQKYMTFAFKLTTVFTAAITNII